jgi:hypothetical protein
MDQREVLDDNELRHPNSRYLIVTRVPSGCHLALETVQSVCASKGTVFFCGSIQRFTGTV